MVGEFEPHCLGIWGPGNESLTSYFHLSKGLYLNGKLYRATNYILCYYFFQVVSAFLSENSII